MDTVFPQKYDITLKQWHKMGEANVFSPDSHLELIDGEILQRSPIGFFHSGHLNRLNKLFTLLVADNAIASVQNPLQLSKTSEPQPDFMLLKPEIMMGFATFR